MNFLNDFLNDFLLLSLSTNVLTNFHLLVNFIRHTGPMVTMVTRCTGSLSQLPVVEMSWGKKSKKKPSVLNNFYFLVNFIRHTGPMVTRCTVTLFQLPMVEISWGENLRKNLMFWQTFISWSISSDALVAWSPHVNRYTGYLSQLHSSTANILSAICHPSSVICHPSCVMCHR